MIKEWFEEYYYSGIGKLHQTNTHNFIIYKGFKITEDPEHDYYEIMDVRFSDFYTEVTQRDLSILASLGFIMGADLLMYERDKERVSLNQTLLEELYKQKGNLPSKKSEYTPHKYKLRQQALNKEIRECVNEKFFYETRKNQIEIKYKIEDE